MIEPGKQPQNATFGFFISFVAIGPFVSSAIGSDVVLRAKAANVISLQLQTRSEVSDFDLDVSLDGETYRNCTVGLPRAWQLFFTINQTARNVTITVPVVGAFGGSAGRFLFREPGHYRFRWTVNYKDGSERGVIEQEVVVLASSDADLAFIEGLADPALCRLILGQRWYDEFMDPNVQHYSELEPRAVKVIGRLLYATRGKTPESAMGTASPQGDMVNTAKALLDLANEIPDSSFAPYAAYYAGCCFASTSGYAVDKQGQKEASEGRFEDETAHRRRLYVLHKADPRSAKGKEAFLFAAERADEYLKPRAIYQAARHTLSRGELEEADELICRAELAAPGSGTVGDLVQKLRSNFDRNRAKFERAVAEKKAPE
ncbi:MAG: hypothetical protein IH987_10345 [Planctomycetes bacterium]|nr:hypothetical protein [Planctomycetota bacterium]